MKTTRPAPVSAMFLHEFNDVFIFISSTTLEAEINTLIDTIGYQKSDVSKHSSDDFLSVAEMLGSWQNGNIEYQLSGDDIKTLLDLFSVAQKMIFSHRLFQLKNLIHQQKQVRFGDTYAVPQSWSHRWYELVAGRVLHADVICLDVDQY